MKQVKSAKAIEVKKDKAEQREAAVSVRRKDVEAVPDADPEFRPTGNIRQDNARKLFIAGDFAGLKTFKARAKISWQKLGFNEDEIQKITG
jgi:hypothetical protein